MTEANNDYQMYAELVKRVKSGDEEAFAEIYDKTQKLVYVTCYGILGNEQDAEDAMQETYISVYNGISELEGEMAFLSWIKRIAANKALDKCRGRKDTASYDDAVASEDINEEDDNLENLPEALILEKDKRDTLYKIMRKELSDDQFQTILLYYYDELSVKDIAQSMQCPENTIKTKLRLARSKIKNGIEKYEKDNKISLMGAASGTLTLGRFFTEYYGDVRIPAPQNIPFRIAAPKGASTAGKVAAKTATAASAKTAVGASLAKTLGIIGASVAGIGVIAGAVIGINAMLNKDDIEPSEPEISVIEETTTEEPSVIETTTETSATTTETEPVVKKTMEEAYLDVLSRYGYGIIAFESSLCSQIEGDFSYDQDPNHSICYLDIDDDGVNELLIAYLDNRNSIFLHDRVNLAIYTYSADMGDAICLLDIPMGGELIQDEWSEVALLDNGNLLIANYNMYKGFGHEQMSEIELNADSIRGYTINNLEIKCYIGGPDISFYFESDSATLNDQSITNDEFLNAYDDYKTHVVLPLFEEREILTASPINDFNIADFVSNQTYYYKFNDLVTVLGGDPASLVGDADTIFEPKCDWKNLYLDKIKGFTVSDFDEGYVSDIAACILTYDLVYINDDEMPELAIQLSDSNSDNKCLIIYSIYDEETVELCHYWCGGSDSFIIIPKNNRIELVSSVEGDEYDSCFVVLFNSECSAVMEEDNLARAIEADGKNPNYYWCRFYSLTDTGYVYTNGYPYEWCTDLNPSKSLDEITSELSQ